MPRLATVYCQNYLRELLQYLNPHEPDESLYALERLEDMAPAAKDSAASTLAKKSFDCPSVLAAAISSASGVFAGWLPQRMVILVRPRSIWSQRFVWFLWLTAILCEAGFQELLGEDLPRLAKVYSQNRTFQTCCNI